MTLVVAQNLSRSEALSLARFRAKQRERYKGALKRYESEKQRYEELLRQRRLALQRYEQAKKKYAGEVSKLKYVKKRSAFLSRTSPSLIDVLEHGRAAGKRYRSVASAEQAMVSSYESVKKLETQALAQRSRLESLRGEVGKYASGLSLAEKALTPRIVKKEKVSAELPTQEEIKKKLGLPKTDTGLYVPIEEISVEGKKIKEMTTSEVMRKLKPGAKLEFPVRTEKEPGVVKVYSKVYTPPPLPGQPTFLELEKLPTQEEIKKKLGLPEKERGLYAPIEFVERGKLVKGVRQYYFPVKRETPTGFQVSVYQVGVPSKLPRPVTTFKPKFEIGHEQKIERFSKLETFYASQLGKARSVPSFLRSGAGLVVSTTGATVTGFALGVGKTYRRVKEKPWQSLKSVGIFSLGTAFLASELVSPLTTPLPGARIVRKSLATDKLVQRLKSRIAPTYEKTFLPKVTAFVSKSKAKAKAGWTSFFTSFLPAKGEPLAAYPIRLGTQLGISYLTFKAVRGGFKLAGKGVSKVITKTYPKLTRVKTVRTSFKYGYTGTFKEPSAILGGKAKLLTGKKAWKTVGGYKGELVFKVRTPKTTFMVKTQPEAFTLGLGEKVVSFGRAAGVVYKAVRKGRYAKFGTLKVRTGLRSVGKGVYTYKSYAGLTPFKGARVFSKSFGKVKIAGFKTLQQPVVESPSFTVLRGIAKYSYKVSGVTGVKVLKKGFKTKAYGFGFKGRAGQVFQRFELARGESFVERGLLKTGERGVYKPLFVKAKPKFSLSKSLKSLKVGVQARKMYLQSRIKSLTSSVGARVSGKGLQLKQLLKMKTSIKTTSIATAKPLTQALTRQAARMLAFQEAASIAGSVSKAFTKLGSFTGLTLGAAGMAVSRRTRKLGKIAPTTRAEAISLTSLKPLAKPLTLTSTSVWRGVRVAQKQRVLTLQKVGQLRVPKQLPGLSTTAPPPLLPIPPFAIPSPVSPPFAIPKIGGGAPSKRRKAGKARKRKAKPRYAPSVTAVELKLKTRKVLTPHRFNPLEVRPLTGGKVGIRRKKARRKARKRKR